MEYKLISTPLKSLPTPCLVIGIDQQQQLTQSGIELDHLSNGYLTQQIRSGDIQGKLGQTLLLRDIPNIAALRVLIIGMGELPKLQRKSFQKLLNAAINFIKNTAIDRLSFCLEDIPVQQCDLTTKLMQTVMDIEANLYRFDSLKSEKENNTQPNLTKIEFVISNSNISSECEKAIQKGVAISEGMTFAKTLGNLPANICTPTYLATQATQLSKHFRSIKTEILEEKHMQKLGMNALLSVSKGSHEPAKFIVMDYRGSQDAPIVLIGKGITFDSGGISLKQPANMDEMKYDMCGAASVLGTLHAITSLQLPIHVIGIIASSENLPGGGASKPGDIVTSMSGQTIEILNTDAEGRLVLCDALTYAEQFNPKTVIDIATLTGAMVIALGHHPSGLLTNHQALADELIRAGEKINDRVWQLPLWEDYQEQLDSNFADMANVGGPPAGSITAACFLSRFAKKFHWAHLDIAGTAWKSGKEKGATGRPVALLTQYLIGECEKS